MSKSDNAPEPGADGEKADRRSDGGKADRRWDGAQAGPRNLCPRGGIRLRREHLISQLNTTREVDNAPEPGADGEKADRRSDGGKADRRWDGAQAGPRNLCSRGGGIRLRREHLIPQLNTTREVVKSPVDTSPRNGARRYCFIL
ncbi:hypothetical protein Nepgr_001487 [Nepenthes gracilis]|uniref:Uncharacterized protein n=1 Tax=Nepenthes gracilis TaxID=150966 RepID=A0AAD3P783_NEPGR|nr:hypothetical protein Nepgr_001487 [Nepenthes gracilis]